MNTEIVNSKEVTVSSTVNGAKKSPTKKCMYVVVYDGEVLCQSYTSIKKIYNSNILNPALSPNWIDYKSMRKDMKNGFYDPMSKRSGFTDKYGKTFHIHNSPINQ